MIDRQRIKQRAQRIRPLLIPLILYIGLLTVAVFIAPNMEPSMWRYLVALLPMIPGLFLALGIVKVSSQLDEMENRILLEAVAFSFIVTLILLLSLITPIRLSLDLKFDFMSLHWMAFGLFLKPMPAEM